MNAQAKNLLMGVAVTLVALIVYDKWVKGSI